MRMAIPWLLGALSGCAIFSGPKVPVDTGSTPTDGGGSDGGGVTGDGGGGSGDAGTTDGGLPTDTGDGGTTTDPLCEQTISTGAPTQDCVTTSLSCDTRKVDTLKRGQAEYGATEYTAWYCGWTSGDPWSGRERVYSFRHPGTGTVKFTLDSPCADMDLIVVRWGYFASDGICPSAATTLISECEMTSSSRDYVSIYASTPSDYLVIVDGGEDAEENFSLEIDCP